MFDLLLIFTPWKQICFYYTRYADFCSLGGNLLYGSALILYLSIWWVNSLDPGRHVVLFFAQSQESMCAQVV